MRKPLTWLGIACIALPLLCLAAPVEIEVRVRKGLVPGGGLSASDLVLTENGKPAPILDVRYVAPVERWRDDPSLAEPTWLYVLDQTNSVDDRCQVFPGLRGFLKSELPPGMQISIAGLPFTDQVEALRERVPARSDDEGSLPYLAKPVPETFYDSLVYRDVFAKLAARPGKKIVVLFRSDHDMRAHVEDLQTLAASAVRSRVALHLGMYRSAGQEPPGLVRLGRETGGLTSVSKQLGSPTTWRDRRLDTWLDENSFRTPDLAVSAPGLRTSGRANDPVVRVGLRPTSCVTRSKQRVTTMWCASIRLLRGLLWAESRSMRPCLASS